MKAEISKRTPGKKNGGKSQAMVSIPLGVGNGGGGGVRVGKEEDEAVVVHDGSLRVIVFAVVTAGAIVLAIVATTFSCFPLVSGVVGTLRGVAGVMGREVKDERSSVALTFPATRMGRFRCSEISAAVFGCTI